MTRAIKSIITMKGIWKFSKRPTNATINPQPSASANDWRCLFSYRLVCSPNELLFNVSSRNRRSQTASAKPEPQIIKKGGEPVSRPITAKPTDTTRQMNGSSESGYFRAGSQARPVMTATAAPIHFPAMAYPVVRHSIETIRQVKKTNFGSDIYCCGSLLFPLSTRAG